MMTIREETLAVKRALRAAGIKARVRHERGAPSSWLIITAETGLKRGSLLPLWDLRERIVGIMLAATGRNERSSYCDEIRFKYLEDQ